MLYLNLGSGVHPAPGWVNVDWVVEHPVEASVDVAANVLDLPFVDECADRVYICHTLEHLAYGDDAPQMLREAWRVLRWNGELAVVGPAMDLAVEQNQPQHLLDAIQAGGGDLNLPGSAHQWTATSRNTWVLVQSVFPNAMLVPVRDIHRMTGWANNDIAGWQVAVLASKVDPL